ncbi:MAG: hypothetical protein WCA35_04805 [Kovacikia sp.]
MLNDLRWFAPLSQPILEALEVHQVTQEFRWEVQYREEFDRYCEWYRMTAKKNQQELQKLQGDLNLFGWFCRKQ